MDRSKPGKGILASLEHKGVETPRRPGTVAPSSAPSAARGASLLVCSGVLLGALVAWWLYSGPSPVIVHETLPPMVQAALSPSASSAEIGEAAEIVDEALPPAQPSLSILPTPAAVPAPARIAAMVRHDRVAKASLHPKPKPAAKPKARQVVAAREPVRRTPRTAADTDVVLLSALVAHADERDVVEPRTGDSTESLLQRCWRVGGEEGRLCRVRICSSRGGESACNDG
ncbi:hypothetical protein [Pseudoduganella lutea]|uniref:Uncharacterized protein n=1 Tax=Pseudoduganella lutea TaxID=321985 RepID=A0A4P6L1D5_9BURK|nr:hypothetical protein [Pseudoduganella lutea]QBE65147.1 hypothetical protein EWM63_20890 [Pseudoduganella lutea]